jgi:predicted RNA-binding protein with PIN domain
MPILIDGYNLLRAIQKRESMASLDEAGLIRILTDYLRRTRDRGQIIFDGIGPPDKSALGGFRNIEVFFSGQQTDADAVIEEKIEDNTAPRSLVVVSSDRRLVAAAKRRKALSLGADLFWAAVCKLMEKEPPRPEPKEKRHGITESETNHWMDLFGMDKS